MFEGSSLNGLLLTPLVPAAVAGALAALFVVLAVIALRRAGAAGMQRWLLPAATLVIAALAMTLLLERMALNERATERRALLQRSVELAASALAPGSMLSCLDGGAGEAVGNACEKAVFADPQTAAAAVAYTGARLTLLKDAAAFAERGDSDVLYAFAATRRALELDRYGLAAHVLAEREGCTADRCEAFALLRDAGALKANMRVRAFDTYVARYVATWNKTESKDAPKIEPMAEKQAPPTGPALTSAPEPQAETPARQLSSKYDFPSAASIPPVSIMNAEPPLPKNAEAPAASADSATVPVPPKRPQTQASNPPAR